ncbi:MAG TPA: O-antigen ligase family protein [Solirubrobacterales bacterium]
MGLGLTYKFFPSRLQGHWLIVTPVAILVGVLATRRLWELPPAVTMCVAIALSIFSGGWGQIGLSGIPLNRLFIVLALLQVFLRAPGTAHMPRVQIRNVHLLMCFTVMYVFASAATSGTLTSKASLLSLFDVFGIAPFLMFLVAPSVFSGQRERNLLLTTLVGIGIYLGITAIFEILGPHGLVVPSYITANDVIRPGVLRAGGPFQSPVANGFATFACSVAALMAFLQWRQQRKRYIALAAGTVSAFGCFLTLERGVWIAATAAIAVTALGTRTGRRWLVPGFLVCALAIGGALFMSSALAHKTSQRANAQESVWDRQNQTSAGLRMVADKPLLGVGWDRYEARGLDYFRQPADYPMTGYTSVVTIGTPAPILPLHNTYLAYAVELGLLGAVLWLASLGWAIGIAALGKGPSALRPWKLGLLAIAAFFLVVGLFDPHKQPFPMVLLMTWAGIALGSKPLSAHARNKNTSEWNNLGVSSIAT